MTDEKSGTRSSVGLLDIASRVPGLLMDAPTILRGVITGFGARPSAKTSIGKVFQDRAAQYADKVFLKFEDQRDHLPGSQRDRQPLRRRAGRPRGRPRRRRRHHAAQLAGTGADHAGSGQMRCDLRDAELQPARRRAEAQPGTAVGQGRRRRPGLRRSDQGERRRHRRSRNVGDIGFSAGDPRRVQASRRHRADEQPGHRRRRCWPRTRRSTSSRRAPPACRRPAS